MDGGELMADPVEIPEHLRPISPDDMDDAFRIQEAALLLAEASREPLEPFSLHLERPPLPAE
jgi:hypothetical protein